jgi:2-polyprenyl-3-methyl-5-hydroxy-6-metoxy-1,4-benzoquinol methylase
MLSTRATQPELMDNPQCDTGALYRTFGHLRLINALFTRSRHLARRFILPHIAATNRPLTVVDLGCGGGDFAAWLWHAAAPARRDTRIVCVDTDPRALAYAREHCARRRCEGIVFAEGSVAVLSTLKLNADFVFANHLLHHFDDPLVPQVLRQIHDSARQGYVLNDIHRSTATMVLYAMFASAMLHRSFALADGLLSIRRGFTVRELRSHAQTAGLSPGLSILRLAPGRVAVLGGLCAPGK